MLLRLVAKFHAVSMPRVVIAALSLLVLVAFGVRAVGWLEPDVFGFAAMAASLLVLVGGSIGASLVLGRFFNSDPSVESAVISGLILWFLVWPELSLIGLVSQLGLAAIVQASKYLIAWRARHIVNPVAAGLVLAWLVNVVAGRLIFPPSMWWVANEAMLWPVFVAGVVVVWRTGRPMAPWVFVLLAGTWTSLAINGAGMTNSVPEAVTVTLASTPLVFLAGFMLTEPLTLPTRRRDQAFVAVVAAMVFALPWTSVDIGFSLPEIFLAIPGELALVASGALAFAFGQRGARVTLMDRREVGRDVVEYRFLADRVIPIQAGQYIELNVPHARPDGRGRRRPFSPISLNGREIVIATRHPDAASTYKRALAKLELGDRARITAVHGDFVLPKSGPVLLVAAGIGVTPILAQLAANPGRDIVLILGVRDGFQPYQDEAVELADRAIVVPVDKVTPALVRDQVSDFKDRKIFVSGRPEFVRELSLGLSTTFTQPRTDHFWGT